MITPSLWIVTAHLIGDFPLQPDWIASTKTENNTRLAIHVAVHVFLNIPIAWWLFPAEIGSQFALLAWIGLTHLVIDHRRWIEPKEGWGHDGMMWVWLNDQIMHLAALSLAIPIADLGPWG